MSDQYIAYNDQFHIMICHLCEYGIPKNGIGLHYRRHHKDLSLQTRKELVLYANNFDLVENIEYPDEIIPPITGIKIDKGMVCSNQSCNYACILQSSMEKHCQLQHDWVSTDGNKYDN